MKKGRESDKQEAVSPSLLPSFPAFPSSFPRKRESRIRIDPRFHEGDRKEVVIPANAGIHLRYSYRPPFLLSSLSFPRTRESIFSIHTDSRFHEGDKEGLSLPQKALRHFLYKTQLVFSQENINIRLLLV